jgi:predicted TIM-barrel fold metal-dependent hydrolase
VFEIVDSQVHIWADEAPDPATWPDPAGVPGWTQTALTVDSLLATMAEAGVTRAFLVPPAFDGVGSNDYCLRAAAAHPGRFAVMGRVPLDDPRAPKLIAEWAEQPFGIGLRFSVFMPRQRQWLEDETAEKVLPILNRLGMSLAIYPGPDPTLLRRIGDIASRYDGLRISIDHMAVGPYVYQDDLAFEHLDALNALAVLPNVAVKASGLPDYSTAPYPFNNIHEYLRRTIDSFGPERVFWGTDFPRLSCSYREAVTMFTEELDWLDESELELVMGRAICEWHGWRPELQVATVSDAGGMI